MRILTWMLMLTMSIFMFAKDKTVSELPYEIEGAGVGSQGTYLVTITVTTKDKKIADDLLKKCAVHGVLFRGFSNVEAHQSQKPLAGSAAKEAANADYFNSFFEENQTYRNYASMVPGSRQVLKSGKQYKVSAKMTIMKDQLSKDLQNAGILTGLNSAF